ncbi:MAG: hypothetical protein ACOH2M_18225 [Cypionkella sp.]
MNKITASHKISKTLAVAGLLIAGGFAMAIPASAAPANCLMTANPAISLDRQLSSYAEAVRNANVDKCQVAQERAEENATKVNSSNVNTANADQDEHDARKVNL